MIEAEARMSGKSHSEFLADLVYIGWHEYQAEKECPVKRERITLEERLSRELDEAIEQQHFARVRFTEACQAVTHARLAYDACQRIEISL
jgi:hypothetical protein